MQTSTDGRSFVFVVFDADGYECKSLSAIFATETEADDYASRLRVEAEAEHAQLFSGEWRPPMRRAITVESVEVGAKAGERPIATPQQDESLVAKP